MLPESVHRRWPHTAEELQREQPVQTLRLPPSLLYLHGAHTSTWSKAAYWHGRLETETRGWMDGGLQRERGIKGHAASMAEQVQGLIGSGNGRSVWLKGSLEPVQLLAFLVLLEAWGERKGRETMRRTRASSRTQVVMEPTLAKHPVSEGRKRTSVMIVIRVCVCVRVSVSLKTFSFRQLSLESDTFTRSLFVYVKDDKTALCFSLSSACF